MDIGKTKAEALVSLARVEATPREPLADGAVCGRPAPATVRDAWGDSCAGHPCLKGVEHGGRHIASDGANGWVYWTEERT